MCGRAIGERESHVLANPSNFPKGIVCVFFKSLELWKIYAVNKASHQRSVAPALGRILSFATSSRKQAIVREWMAEMKDNRKEGKAEQRGGEEERKRGRGSQNTVRQPERTLKYWHRYPYNTFTCGPMQKGKVNVYLKASLCSANVSFPSLRIRRKNKRVSSARHSPKSSAYGGYFNFLIPSFLWVASLNTHTHTLPPLLVFLFLSNSLSPPPLPHFLFRLSHSDKHACTHRMQVSLHLWEWESERERGTSVRWLQERLKRNGVEPGLSQNWSFVSWEGQKEKKRKNEKLCKKQHEGMEIWVCISYC